MQYETIILELLSRIKKLEDEVNELKQTIGDRPVVTQNITPENYADDSSSNEASVSYKKMTDEMIDICYMCGKKLRDGENIQDLADCIVEETGMNRNSAIMYLYAVQGMLDGTVYKRTISAKATKIFFTKIFNEYGSAGLKTAIRGTRLHAQYRRECGLPYENMEEICNVFESRL